MGICTTRSSANSGGINESLKDYLKNSSVTGSLYYFAPGTRPKERIFWLAAHVACVIYLVVMTVNATLSFWRTPTVTTEETSRYPMRDIDFPSVSICEVNKISYSAAVKLAEDILEYKNITDFNHPDIVGMLKYLGHLYGFELNDGEEDLLDSLHQLLIKRYGSYVPKILKRLVPSCREMMHFCSWGGRQEICDDIFSLQMTGDGWCCTFNHIHRGYNFGHDKYTAEIQSFIPEIQHSHVSGAAYGLTVLMRSEVTNHYYKTLPMMGYKILINPSLDFPDAPSGGVRKVFVAPRTESSLILDATPFYSVPEVSRYSRTSRGCIFSNEYPRKSKRFYYSFNDCISHCRAVMMNKCCDCVPFSYWHLMHEAVPPRVCDLRDLPCLKKNRAKFMSVPSRADLGYDDREFYHGVKGYMGCVACTPTCADVVYKASVSSSPLTASTVWMGKNIYKIDGHSIVRIFFKHTDTIRLKHDVLFEWYDLMSNYGGFCGLFLGVSVISLAEFIYFFTLRLCRRPNKLNRERNSVKAAKVSLPLLYCNEIPTECQGMSITLKV